MPSFRLTTNLLIAGASVALFTMSALADSSTMQTLGTLHSNEVGGTAAVPVPSGAPQSAAVMPAVGNQPVVPDTSVLQPVQVGNITYVTGGIGDEERDALQSAKANYNLHVVSATPNNEGAFVGTTQITIKDRAGNALLTADAGPIFLANLPAGNYVIEASAHGQTKQQRVTVGAHKAAHVHLSW